MSSSDIDVKTAFAIGFASRCAEEQLALHDIDARIHAASLRTGDREKTAFDLFTALFGGKAVTDTASNVATGVARGARAVADAAKTYLQAAGLSAALGGVAGGLGGGALGWAAAKANEPDIDPEDIKKKEIESTYQHYANRLAARRKYEQARLNNSVLS